MRNNNYHKLTTDWKFVLSFAFVWNKRVPTRWQAGMVGGNSWHWWRERHTGVVIGVGIVTVGSNCVMNNLVNYSVVMKKWMTALGTREKDREAWHRPTRFNPLHPLRFPHTAIINFLNLESEVPWVPWVPRCAPPQKNFK